MSLGIAIDISSACDIRICTKDTQFSIKEVDIGLAADTGSLQRLPRIVGNDSWTRELALSGRYFSASEALEKGFVSYVLSTQAMALDRAMHIAKLIAEKSPIAVQGTKTLMDYSRDHTIREGILLKFIVNDRVGVYAALELYLFADGSISDKWQVLTIGFKGGNRVVLRKTKAEVFQIVEIVQCIYKFPLSFRLQCGKSYLVLNIALTIKHITCTRNNPCLITSTAPLQNGVELQPAVYHMVNRTTFHHHSTSPQTRFLHSRFGYAPITSLLSS